MTTWNGVSVYHEISILVSIQYRSSAVLFESVFRYGVHQSFFSNTCGSSKKCWESQVSWYCKHAIIKYLDIFKF